MKKSIVIIAITFLFFIIAIPSFTQSTVEKKGSVEQQQEWKEVFEGAKAITRLMFIRDAETGTWKIIIESPTKAFYFSGATLDAIKNR